MDNQLLRHVRQQLNWHYRIRIKSNCWVWRAGFGWQQLNQFHLGRGQALMLQNVKLHKHHSVDGAHLALARENQEGTLWLIVSSEPTTLQKKARIRIEIRY